MPNSLPPECYFDDAFPTPNWAIQVSNFLGIVLKGAIFILKMTKVIWSFLDQTNVINSLLRQPWRWKTYIYI